MGVELVGRPRKYRVIIRRAKIGARADSVRDHGNFLVEPVDELCAVTVVNVDDGDRLRLASLFGQAGEKFHLRLEIILHRPVKIEMVLGEVGEDRDVPFEATNPVLRERVRRDLHRGGLAASVDHLREQFLNFERLGRCPNRGQNPVHDFVAHRPEQSATHARFLTNMFDQERRGRLAVRAGHRGEFQSARGPFIERCGQIGQHGPRVLDHETGGARLFFFALRHDD